MMLIANVYVVIVTYNGTKWIEKCLATLQASDITLHVIIVDNGSTDGTQNLIRTQFPQFDFIQSPQNLGFGSANNIGIKKAIHEGAEHVFLLNQDGYLEPDTISKLVSFQKANPIYGVLSPKQLNGAGTDLDSIFKTLVMVPQNYLDDIDLKNTAPCISVKFVMAAFWLISAECIKKVGVFDPIFFHYGEDNDYLNRVLYHNFKIGVLSDAVGYHDREERSITDLKRLHINYSALLSTATDINNSLAYSALNVSYKSLKSVSKSLLQLRFDLVKYNIQRIADLGNKYKAIIQSRRKNKLNATDFQTL